jgi:hypothetical protein
MMATCYFLWCHHRGQEAFGARGGVRCDLSQGKILVFDRGYMDCEWPLEFGQAGVHLVARLKENADYWVAEERPLPNGQVWSSKMRGISSSFSPPNVSNFCLAN